MSTATGTGSSLFFSLLYRPTSLCSITDKNVSMSETLREKHSYYYIYHDRYLMINFNSVSSLFIFHPRYIIMTVSFTRRCIYYVITRVIDH